MTEKGPLTWGMQPHWEHSQGVNAQNLRICSKHPQTGTRGSKGRAVKLFLGLRIKGWLQQERSCTLIWKPNVLCPGSPSCMGPWCFTPNPCSQPKWLFPDSPANMLLCRLSRVSPSKQEISSGFTLQWPAQNKDSWVRDMEGDSRRCMSLIPIESKQIIKEMKNRISVFHMYFGYCSAENRLKWRSLIEGVN